jgi:hypothetical protein
MCTFTHQSPPLLRGAEYEPRHFFLEVAVWKEVDIPDDLLRAFRKRQPEATNQLLAIAEQNKESFVTTITLLAGTIGLRFHQQFVIEVVNENPFVLRGEDDFEISTASPAVRNLNTVSASTTNTQALSDLLQLIGRAPESARAFAANALGWLIRAWYQHDSVSQFLMFFIALEFVLEGISGSLQAGFQEMAEKVHRLIQSYAGDDRETLERFWSQAIRQQRPSLNSRFEELARTAGLPGWEQDIAAFRTFNKMRNDLLHQGEPGVRISVSVTEDEVRHFQDLVERYVSFRVFGDALVYSDHWLPRPRPHA